MTDQQYYEFIQPYTDAMQILLTRVDILKHSLYGDVSLPSVHNIQERIKKKQSIEEKLAKRGLPSTVASAKDYLQDIAGIRIICYFVNDIYSLVHALKKQADLVLIREQDYITHPKPNGYRSYHLILGIPVYCMDGMEYFPVEIQLRTMSMDIWASMEHRILYKKSRSDRPAVTAELKEYAEMLLTIEKRFEKHSETGEFSISDTGEKTLKAPPAPLPESIPPPR